MSATVESESRFPPEFLPLQIMQLSRTIESSLPPDKTTPNHLHPERKWVIYKDGPRKVSAAWKFDLQNPAITHLRVTDTWKNDSRIVYTITSGPKTSSLDMQGDIWIKICTNCPYMWGQVAHENVHIKSPNFSSSEWQAYATIIENLNSSLHPNPDSELK